MNPKLREFFDQEMNQAILMIENKQLDQAFYHLERAHILGQKYVIPHIKIHFWMLKVGLIRKSTSEVLGQILRIILGAIGSFVGIVPIGNTGGTNINMFARMPITKDLETIINSTKT